MNKVLCTICARGGSKGVKGKNVRDLLGKPLISYSIEQALKSKLFDHVVVSSDSELIMDISKEYGADVFFKRSEDLSTDQAGKLQVIRDAFVRSEEFYQTKFDYLVDLDATSPLRSIDDIINSFNQLIKDKNENLITAMPARRSPYFNLIELDNNNKVSLSKELKNPIVRRQDSPKCFDMNASIYVWKRDTILNSNSIFLETTGLYVMPENRSIDIDTELDFKFVEYIMNRNENDR